MPENFLTGAMTGYAFVKDQQRQDDKAGREKVLQGRQDAEYQNKLDLNKIQAVRFAIASGKPGEDPMTNLTKDQRELVESDPGVKALIESPELRTRRAQNLALIDEGFNEYRTALATPPAAKAQVQAQAAPMSNLELQRSRATAPAPAPAPASQPAQPAVPTALQKMIKGAQGEWGDQINAGKDQFGADIAQVAQQFPGLAAPDGSPIGKQIQMLHPSDDGKSLAFELKVTTIARDEKGNPVIDPATKQPQIVQYTAPATENRDGSPNAPVIFHPISTLTRDLQMRARLLAYADARAVELGSDLPIKRQQEIEVGAAKASATLAEKAAEAKTKLAEIEFEQGKISERELKKAKETAAADIEKENLKHKNDKELEHIKGGYALKGKEISAAGKKAADGVKEMTKGQAATIAARLLKQKNENDGELDPDEQLLLDVTLKHSTGKEPEKGIKGDGRQTPIPPRGQQPKPVQAIGAGTPAPAPAKKAAPAAKKPAPKVDLEKFWNKK